EVHLEPAAIGWGEGDRGVAIVDRRQLGRHTDGHREIPSDDAVDDLDVNFAFGHVALLGDWCPAWYRYLPDGAIARDARHGAPREPRHHAARGEGPMRSSTEGLRLWRGRGQDIGLGRAAAKSI